MKRTNTLRIAQVINEVLKDYKIDSKLREARIISAWHEVLGPLARPDDKLYIRNRTLFAYISSSVVRNELHMMRSTLMKGLNEQAGYEVITDIVIK